MSSEQTVYEVTDGDSTSNGRLSPFCPVESFEHVQNFPPDRMDINGHHRTRNGFTGLETDIKRIRTDTNGLKEFLSVTHPLARTATLSINCTVVYFEYLNKPLRTICVYLSRVHMRNLHPGANLLPGANLHPLASRSYSNELCPYAPRFDLRLNIRY